MESPEAPLKPTTKRMRLILNLGKFVVMERSAGSMKVALGGSTTMTAMIPEQADVQTGDLLTLYTEVLLKDAQP